ncbi:MAG: hypothetical protein ACI9KE_000520 [Polyangiales bacterium]|jgi:hypothetical protein
MALMRRSTWLLLTLALGCGPLPQTDLRLSEFVSSNEGVAVDESGETEDYIELYNAGEVRIWLDAFTLSDSGTVAPLPELPLGPGERIIFYADGEVEEGERHLPFKLSSGGEQVQLRSRSGHIFETIEVPALAENESYARFPDDDEGEFMVCRYASPNAANGDTCGPPTPPEVSVEPFEPYAWALPFPTLNSGVRITEAALRPAAFVELTNAGSGPVDLSSLQLRLVPHGPSLDWPGPADGMVLPLSGVLAVGERIHIDVAESDLSDVAATDQFEGVLTLFEGSAVQDRLDFMAWPEDTVLARYPSDDDHFVFCAMATPGSSNESCAPILSRPVADRLRHLRTPGDFDALAAGGTTLGLRAVKFIIDLERGDSVHLIGAEAYGLHYTYVRENIFALEPLDRCDAEQASVFRAAWSRYSVENYSRVAERRFLGGTLTEHTGAGVRSVDFVTGDSISAAQMQHAFFTLAPHLLAPSDWTLRPQGNRQAAALQTIEGMAPIVGEDAIRSGVRFQPLNAAVNYGLLRYVSGNDLNETPLSSEVILLTDEVPNDLPLVGGVITEALQTPLAHVNVLSRGRGTPNMALRDAREDPRIAPMLDQLVRFEVSEGDFSIRSATRAEAEAFWEERRPQGPRIAPRLDPAPRELVDLSGATLDDVAVVGAKAAQLGVLSRITANSGSCMGPVATPEEAFGIPVSFYLDHFEASGARAYLAAAMQRDDFAVDTRVRANVLADVRDMISGYSVDPLVLELSNVEDLSEFSGAGLYTSASAELGDSSRSVEDALRIVWGSLWNHRAFEERERGHIEQSAVAMGILVHAAFRSELANGIGVSRNVLDLTRGDIYYFNVQIGEAGVANPAPGVRTDEYVYRFGRSPRVVFESRSSLTPFDILREEEYDEAACVLRAIHNGFRPLLDPERENAFFAMDIEWKLVGPDRRIVVKQARPYDVGDAEVPADCRNF